MLELAINRLAVPLLRPHRGAPPAWHTVLDYAGLFLFYFASLLGVIAAGLRAYRAFDRLLDPSHAPEPGPRWAALATAAPLAALAVLSSWAILVAPSEGLTFALEACLAAVAFVQIGRGASWFLGQPRDLGVTLGVALLAAPLAVHFFAMLGARYWWPEGTYDGVGAAMGQASGLALAIAGLASPYCLAPRPFVRSVTRLAPVLVAISVAVVAAMLLRHDYLGTAQAIKLAIGVELQTTSADPQLTIYLLAMATLSWTITSCALAPKAPRRLVAVGLALLVLGGHAFEWPLHYLLLALGLVTLADVSAPVRAAEREVPGAGPAVEDATWGRYLGAVSATLRRRCASLHSLTTRSAEGATSSVLVGEADGRALRIRIDREEGVVIGLDIAIGRDLELTGRGGRGGVAATLTVVGDEPYLLEDAPPAQPQVSSADAAFDERFRCFGAAAELRALFDERTRPLAVTLLDGWLACAHGESLRYRSYLRHGATDPVIPLDDLGQGHVPGGAGERMRVMVELLLELAARAEVRTAAERIVAAEAARDPNEPLIESAESAGASGSRQLPEPPEPRGPRESHDEKKDGG